MGHRALQRVVEAYVDGQLAAGSEARVAVHLRECWDCGEHAEVLRTVKASLRRRDRRVVSLEVARLRRAAYDVIHARTV
jgi:anti-sigma factor RsiW